ncbi:sensor histidine kinase [Pseudorhodoplanes sinuspersici]|nr:ATP-binding protein [Pseudorhodoplanes sinuspersici]
MAKRSPSAPRTPSRVRSERRQIENALAALAHDIRTPLTGVLALSELLAASDLPERERGWANAIKRSAEHLSLSTSIVLDAVKADATGLVLRKEVFSPRELAEDVAASLVARTDVSGLSAGVSIAEDLPETAKGDPVRLRAALENIADNAVKFTARGQVSFNVTAKLAPRNRVQLTFAVSDSGIGMTPAEIKKLFRPFAQANEDISRRFGGTGLGLVLVRRLAKAMDGDLTVTSKPGQGSTFTLTVQVAPVAT